MSGSRPSTIPSGLLDQDGGGAFAFGPRGSSSFGTATSPRSFTWDSQTLSIHAGHAAAAFKPLSAATTPELLSSRTSSLLPSAVIDTATIELGPRRESLDRGVLSSSTRAHWTAEQHAYRDVAADPFSAEDIATELLSPRNPFSPNSSNHRRSTSTYSMSSSSQSAPYKSYAGPITPGTSPRAGSRPRRQSPPTSEPESTPPVKRTSPRKVATVTTTFDSKGSPTKSIRRISKLNLDASPSSRSPSVSPRKSARRQPPRLAPAPAPGSRDSEQVPGQIGPARGNVTRSKRRVSFGAVEHAPVPSVLLPADPINLSVSGVTLSPEDFALLEEATLLAEDELPLPPPSAPPWCTSFELPTPPEEFYGPTTGGGTYDRPFYKSSFSAYEQQVRPPGVSSFVLPANPHARAHSAYSETSITPYPNGLTLPAAIYPPPASPVARRRRSSTSSYDYVPVSSQRYPVPASPWTSGFPTSHDQNPQLLPPQQQQGPRTFKLPAYGPSSASSSSPSPASDSRPVTPPPISGPAPLVVTPSTGGYPARAISAPTPKAPSSPKKKRSPAKTKRQPGAMFVNYSAQDANKLLKGVAPSGSTRKRREEEEARRRAAIEA
ncbi:hypothetical protein RHOSPDRAFT_34469 [Rhodotorula sp. JG-1b]|nr:hypothetical protein RHOSPDRAFT_34469 [Rhodotorula sp. JG-1b]